MTMMDFLRRLWQSAIFMTWSSLGVRLAGIVVVLPLVLVRFSPADVAVWQLFSTLITLTLVLDFGLSPTFSRFLSYARGGAKITELELTHGQPRSSPEAVAKGDVVRVFACLRWLYPRLAGLVFCFLAVVGTMLLAYPISQTVNPTDSWLAWGIIAICAYFALLSAGYAATLQGMDRIAQLRQWEVITGVGQILSAIATLLVGGDLLELVIAYQSWTIVGFVRNYLLLKRLHPELAGATRERHPDILRAIWPATWRSGLGVVMSHGIIQGSGLIYGQLAPAAEVAAYLLALRIVTTISQFSQAPFYSKLPKLAELQARGERTVQLGMAKRGMRLAHWVFTLGVVAIALFVSPILEHIGSKTEFVSHAIWAVIALAFFVERFGAMHLQLYSLTNHIVWHIANGVTGVLMVVIAVLLYPLVGAMAFPLGMLIAYAGFYAIYAARYSLSALKIGFVDFESRVSIGPVCVLGAGLGASFFLHLGVR